MGTPSARATGASCCCTALIENVEAENPKTDNASVHGAPRGQNPGADALMCMLSSSEAAVAEYSKSEREGAEERNEAYRSGSPVEEVRLTYTSRLGSTGSTKYLCAGRGGSEIRVTKRCRLYREEGSGWQGRREAQSTCTRYRGMGEGKRTAAPKTNRKAVWGKKRKA
jgi:hypothetical protein